MRTFGAKGMDITVNAPKDHFILSDASFDQFSFGDIIQP
jgi:hypothetical protein